MRWEISYSEGKKYLICNLEHLFIYMCKYFTMLILHFQWFNVILQNSWKFNTQILQVGGNLFLPTTGYMSLKELYKTKIQKYLHTFLYNEYFYPKFSVFLC